MRWVLPILVLWPCRRSSSARTPRRLRRRNAAAVPAAGGPTPALPPRPARTSRPTTTSASSATGAGPEGPSASGCTSTARNSPTTSTGRKGVNCQRLPRRRLQEQRGQRSPRQGERLPRGGRGGAEDVRPSATADQALELVKSVHAKAGQKNEQGRGTPLSCRRVTGPTSIRSCPWRTSDRRSLSTTRCKPVAGATRSNWETYGTTVHGHGLYEAGLLVTATCANCHGAHGIYRAADRRSTLYPANVAATCGKCHRFIAERLQASIHGRGTGPGGLAEAGCPGRKLAEAPSCTSCHQGHEIAMAESPRFRQHLPNLCGNCHANLSGRYAMSIHGELTELGYDPAANCYDCHGSHSIHGRQRSCFPRFGGQPLDDLPSLPPPCHGPFCRVRSARQLPRSQGQPASSIGCTDCC